MNYKEILLNKEFQYHRISSLFILMIALFSGLISILIPFLIEFIPKDIQGIFKISLVIISEGILALHWHKNRSIFPKSKRKQNIVIAIVTENEKQKNRISKDFAENLKKQLIKYQLQDKFNVLVLHNALSEKFKTLIENAFVTNNDSNSKDKEVFNRVKNKMNAKFVVFGNLLTRNSPDNTYTLNIEGLINHSVINQYQSKEIQKELQDIWQKEIMFLEKEEINGFKLTSNQIFFASTFMIGLASLADGHYEKGIEISNKLTKYIEEEEKYREFESKVKKLRASSYFLYSRYLALIGQYEKSTNIKRQFLELIPNTYDSCLNEAIHHMKIRNDPETALDFINKAKKLSKGTGEWKYSKLYLLLKLKKEKEALNILDKIISTGYKGEMETINDVLNFNSHCLTENECNIESIFIIGVLLYKKIINLPFAYEKLEEFVKKTDETNQFSLLQVRAKQYIREIERKMKIE